MEKQAHFKEIINRLSRIEGHTRAIKKMVNDEKACSEILIQIAAVRSALDHVARRILEAQLEMCIPEHMRLGDIERNLAELKIALNRFIK